MDNQGQLELGSGVLLLSVKCGEVVGQQKWSETEIHSSGGGGHIGPQGGSISAPTISSTSKTKQELWIREDDGRESSIELVDSEFNAREGQKVWIATGANQKSRSSKYLFAYNNASDLYVDFIPNWISWLYKENLLKKPLIYRLLTTWLSFFIGVVFAVVIFPLIATTRFSSSFFDAAGKVFDSFKYPESVNYALSMFPSIVSAHFGKFIFASLAVWFVSSLILRFIGYFLFLKYWENGQLKKLHNIIFLECRKLAGNYGNSSMKNEG